MGIQCVRVVAEQRHSCCGQALALVRFPNSSALPKLFGVMIQDSPQFLIVRYSQTIYPQRRGNGTGVQLCSIGGKFRSTVGRMSEAISLLMQYVSIGIVGYKVPLCRSQC